MSYIPKMGGNVLVGAGTAKVITATGVSVHSIAVMRQMKVARLLAVVSTAIASNLVAAILSVKYRPIFGSSAGEVVIGTLKFPDLTAVGIVLYKEVSPYDCLPGGQIVFEVTTAGTDSVAAAGAVIAFVEMDDDAEVPGNQTKMLASA